MNTTFDITAYVQQLTAKNKMAAELNFQHTTCSGINYLEEPLQQLRSVANFVCTSDINDEATFQRSGGWFKRRTAMVFILMRYRQGDMDDRRAKMDQCRELFRQFKSRIINDAYHYRLEDLYLNTEVIRSSELGGAFLDSCTGLYFMLSLAEPEPLCYDPKEWTP